MSLGKRATAGAAAVLVFAALAAAGCASVPSTAGQGAGAPPPSAASLVPKGAATADTPKDAGATTSPLPAPTGHVNDFAKVLNGADREHLESRLVALKERTKVEVALATVGTTGGRDIDEYSLAVARGWGIGPKAGEPGGGILLLFAVNDRRWHIQVTTSLEKDLPEETVADLGGVMTPMLREGRYAEAFNKYLDALDETLSQRGRAK